MSNTLRVYFHQSVHRKNECMLSETHELLHVVQWVVKVVVLSSIFIFIHSFIDVSCNFYPFIDILCYAFFVTIPFHSLESKLSTVWLPSILDKSLDCKAVSSNQIPHCFLWMHEWCILLHAILQILNAQVLCPDCKRCRFHNRAITQVFGIRPIQPLDFQKPLPSTFLWCCRVGTLLVLNA